MAGNEPPYLPVGTEVSAKYKGAFCEAKVKKVVRLVKCKVSFKEGGSSVVIPDEFIKGQLKLGVDVEAKREENGTHEAAVISRMNDASTYTVVFDDGDVATLRRTQLCLKGDKHFMESETLDQLPLTHPEHFGSPVVQDRESSHDRKRRRSGRGGGPSSADESDGSSSEEEAPPVRKRTPRTRKDAFVGQILCVEVGDKRKSWYPSLAVMSNAHNVDLKKDQILVRSFKDNKFVAVNKKDVKTFTREMALKNEDKGLKASLEKALLYIDNRELPVSWDKEALIGSDSESDLSSEGSSDDEPTEEKDHFVAQLYKFMDDRATPINKGPFLGNRDLNLYKLFKLVQKYGGYNRVTSQMKWRLVYSKMGLPVISTASHQIKTAYKKYLHAFEDFYRKLGSTMGTISRPGRGRSSGGRSLLSFREKEATRSPKPERKFPVSATNTPDEKSKAKDSEKDKEKPKEVEKAKAKPEEKTKIKPEDKVNIKPEEKGKVKPDEKSKVKPEAKPKPEDKAKVKPEDKMKAKPEDKTKAKLEEKTKVKTEEKKGDKKVTKNEPEPEVHKKKTPVARTKKDDSRRASMPEPEVTGNELGRRSRSQVDRDSEKSESPRRPDSPRRGRPPKLKAEEKIVKKAESDDESVSKKEDDAPRKSGRRRSSMRDGGNTNKEEEKKVEKDDKNEENDESDDETGTPSKGPEPQKDLEPDYPPGVKVKIRYGRGRMQNIYEAKVMEAEHDNGSYQYWVHYSGWNIRYDEWIRKDRIVGAADERDLVKRKREWKIEHSKAGKEREKEKEKETEKEKGKDKHDDSPGSKPKKQGRLTPADKSNTTTAVSPKSAASEPALNKMKPLTPSQTTRARPTRSNSVEVKLSSSLPVRVRRRSRRSSGYTENSDVQSSRVSESESESEHSETEEVAEEDVSVPDDASLTSAKSQSGSSKMETEEKPPEAEEEEAPEINLGSDEKMEDIDKAFEEEKPEPAEKEQIKEDPPELVEKVKETEGKRKRRNDKTEVKATKEDAKTKGKKRDQQEKTVEDDKSKKDSENEEKGKSLKRGDSFRTKRRRVSTDSVRESTPSKGKEEEAADLKPIAEDKLQAIVDIVASMGALDDEDERKVEEVNKKESSEKEEDNNKEEEAEKKKGNKRKTGRKKREEEASVEKELKPNRSSSKEECDVKKVPVKEADTKPPTKSSVKKEDSSSLKVAVPKKDEVETEQPEPMVEEIKTVEVVEKPQDMEVECEAEKSEDSPSELPSQPSTSTTPAKEPMHLEPEAVEEKPVAEQIPSTSVVDNTPPTTPEGSPEHAAPGSPFYPKENEAEQAVIHEGMFLDEKTGLPVSGGESPNDVSTLSNGSGGSSGNAPSDESNGDAQHTMIPIEVQEPPPKKRKRGHKRSATGEKKLKHTPSKPHHASDSDDASNNESAFSSSCASSTRVSPTKRLHSDHTPRTPRPSKYDFCSNLDLEDVEGEKRISILQERIQDIRKIYMQLKSEVASIDRRRKRAKRKEREGKATHSPSVEVESS